MSIWTFVLNLMDLNSHTTIKKNYIEIMTSSTPHQKFCFYHLPTRGRAGIKLRDAWYVSNVSIIFDCSMLLYYLFWMFMGFIKHFHITFGTNLLTQSPVPVPVFSLVSVFRRKGISNGVEMEGKQPGRLGVHVKKATREARGRGRAHPPGAPSTLVAPLWLP